MKTGRPRDPSVLRDIRLCPRCKNRTEHARYLITGRDGRQSYYWRCMPCHSAEMAERYRFLKENPGEAHHRGAAKKEPKVDCCPKCWTARSVTGACLCD